MKDHIRRLIERDFVCGDDGLYMYWPPGVKGGLTPHGLRLIASMLDEKNEDQHRHFEEFFAKDKDKK